MTFEKTDTSLKQSMDALNKNINIISDVLKRYSIDTTDISIAEYSITSEIDNETKRKEYSVRNELTIEIRYNRKLISLLLSEIQTLNLKDVDINLSYGISDRLDSDTRDELKLIAIRDAKKCAEQISKEMDLEIVGVKSISKTGYNPIDNIIDMVKPQIRFTPPVIKKAEENKSSFENYEVKEVIINDDILITFETK